jgi:P-type E1-E2 ATPase
MAEKRGILVRDFSSFEKGLDLDAFVIDKTGTVTEGRWKLLEILPTGLLSRQEVLAKAISVEEQSQHHIASELKKRAPGASSTSLNATDVVVSANGIQGSVQGHEVRIGSRDFMKKELEQFEGRKDLIRLEPNAENSYVYMSTEGKLCAIFVFGDEVKKGSSETIDELKGRGYRLTLVSGDGNDATRAIARRIGLEESQGGKLPEDKAAFIKELQSGKFRVAMVGDGINDAPALAQADLGIALYSGGNLGQEAGDVTLMRGDLRQLLDFLGLAKRVGRKIRQNLAFSAAYNLIAIPVAMSGLLNPLIAVSAMLLSSLSVIGNTLLLIKRED